VGSRFEWDPDKAALNLKDHGISFDEATTVFGDLLALNMPDPAIRRASNGFWCSACHRNPGSSWSRTRNDH
jgi:uncharacterized DUF497 family protein